MADREQRVTPLELFFDLVFVYAVTQVTALMAHDLTWRGVGHGLLVFAVLWWGWTGYAWLTNMLEPEEGRVRGAMFAAMAGMLVAALAVPEAFGRNALVFGLAYLVLRAVNIALYLTVGKRDPDFGRTVAHFAPSALSAPALIVAAAFTHGTLQVVLWLLAIAALYGGALIGHGQGWRISPAHFAERYGAVVIIALGESIVAIGVGARGEALNLGVVTAAVLGVAVVAALWWAYFDVYAVLAQQRLAETSGVTRAGIARDHYSYLHMPMVAGILLFALGLSMTIEAVDEPLATIPALALCCGLSLYYFSHVAMRIRQIWSIRATPGRPGYLGPGRLATAIGMLALIPVALAWPALIALGLAALTCWALIAWDLIRYREHRPQIREAR
jgi:low temperature requirement protein LtrA